MMPDKKQFDPESWAARWKANEARADANANMDSGWSLGTANSCIDMTARLGRELVNQLLDCEQVPIDSFQQPELFGVMEAIRLLKVKP